MRAKEIRERSDDELVRMLAENEDQLFRNRIKNATHQLDNTGQIRLNRREVARIKTVLSERKIAQQQAGGNSEE